jgi:flagellar secretion chaperone FliS
MLGTAVDRYKVIQQATITPGELLLALYDGLFRFMNGARYCIEKGEKPKAREFLCKAHAIVSELYMALDHKVNPELCGNLAAVYDFSMARLMDASREANADYIDEVARVLTPLREAWREAVPLAVKEASQRG